MEFAGKCGFGSCIASLYAYGFNRRMGGSVVVAALVRYTTLPRLVAVSHLLASGHIVCHPLVGTYHGIATNGDAAQYGGVGVDYDAVLEYGVTRIVLDRIAIDIERKALGSERHALIELDMIANDAGGAYHNACAVVDGEVFANLCPRVNVDARLAVCEFADDARNERHIEAIKLVGYAVTRQGAYGRIAAYHLTIVLRGGVAQVGGLYIGGERAAHLWQHADKCGSYGLGLCVEIYSRTSAVVVLLTETESGLHLCGQQCKEALNFHTYMVAHSDGVECAFSVIPWKEHSAAQPYYLFKRCRRGQGVAMTVLMEESLHLACVGQFLHRLP